MAELVLIAKYCRSIPTRYWSRLEGRDSFFFVAEKLSDEAPSRDALLAELRAAPNSQTWLTIT
jgi:hypothetical protein